MPQNNGRTTFDALSEGVAILDPQGVILRCNRAMTQILARPYGEIENATLREIIESHFDLKLPEDGDPFPKQARSGSRFFRLNLNQITSEEHSTGSILIIAEITKEKQAEEALLISERLAATGRMAHTIAHEINNPLEAITNLIYLLQGSLHQPEIAQKYIDSAEKELERVSRISRQILSFNRESAVPIEIPISDLIDDVLALNNRSLVDRAIRVRKEWDSTQTIQGFPAQLRQVFSNLVRNAIEASSHAGEIRIRISKSKLGVAQSIPAVRITIGDHGVGIRPENLNRIFEAFFTTKNLKGSGVGLWLSANIVTEHGGKLQVRSSHTSIAIRHMHVGRVARGQSEYRLLTAHKSTAPANYWGIGTDTALPAPRSAIQRVSPAGSTPVGVLSPSFITVTVALSPLMVRAVILPLPFSATKILPFAARMPSGPFTGWSIQISTGCPGFPSASTGMR